MIGKTFSHYKILEKLGAGGMGEVYRAEDVRLHRQVAVKMLPDMFAADPERLARFEREAKLLAALSHPNIAAIYGLEEAEGKRFLVLELVEGETLAQRLGRGLLPFDEALEVCRQVAEGLEAAHEKSIVHRDLKPSNIKLTPEGKVKILDFGLARAFLDKSPVELIADSPTITAEMTQPGVILGTAAYMSPEQAKGKPVDKRADIWAFGCILFECLTGKSAFPGETISEVLAAVLKGEPDWEALPKDTPANVRAVLRRCIQKDRNLRFHDIADARIEMFEAPVGYPAEAAYATRRPSFVWLAGGAAAFLLAGVLIGRFLIKRSVPTNLAPVVTSTIKVEPDHWLDGLRRNITRPSRTAMAISSDGRFVVYSAIEENPGPQATPRLYLRRLDHQDAKPISGTEGGISPFLSPDNRWVGFLAEGKLKKVPVEGGVPATLCDTSLWVFGADWGDDNSIVFVDGNGAGLSRVSADGGKLETLTKPDHKRQEYSHRLPSWLPNGKAVLFTAIRHAMDSQPYLALLQLDTGDWRVLLQDAADAKYIPTGYLVFLRQGTLMAVRFDPARLEIIGQPVALVENVMQIFATSDGHNTGAGQFAISDTGSLIYAIGGVAPDPEYSLVWVDQRGMEQPVTDQLLPYSVPRLSPDGRRIAYKSSGREWQVWVYDLNRATTSRLTTEGRADYPTWAPDGKRLLFAWRESVAGNLFWQPYDGSSPMERLTTCERTQYPGSWSPAGKTVALVEESPEEKKKIGYQWDINMLDVGTGRVTPFLNSPFNERYPEFSPDGRWIAYTSDESQRHEVYVRPFPGPGMKYPISSEGGCEPLWAKDSKQLYYRWPDIQPNQVWVVDVRTDGGFTAGKPRLLFEKSGYYSTFPIRTYDLSLDGKRFLMVKGAQRKPAPVTEMVLVQNWFEELNRLVPVKK